MSRYSLVVTTPLCNTGENCRENWRPPVASSRMSRLLSTLVALVVLALPATAAAHVERSGYWPDPAPDCSITPCAGGGVPNARSLASALKTELPGTTRVVCKGNSLKLLKASIAKARKSGYDIRPTDHRALGRKAARKLLKVNRRLKKLCGFHEIQPAVNASGNNDRVVVTPGLYTEPTAAAQKTNDPACDQYRTHSDTGDP